MDKNIRKELNTSKSTFKDVIEQNLMYVDKTEEIYDLVNKTDGQFFLSRPYGRTGCGNAPRSTRSTRSPQRTNA